MKNNKLAVAGITGALLLGVGGGFVMSIASGASAAQPAVTVPTDPSVTADTGTADTGTAGDVGGDTDGDHPGMPGRGGPGANLQQLVDDGTITAAQRDSLVSAMNAAHAAAEAATTPEDHQAIRAGVLAAAVAGGTITQAQADAITAAAPMAMPGMGGGQTGPGHGRHGQGGMGPGGIGPGGMGHGPGFGGRGQLLDAAATALGVTADELMTQLQAGKTIADVATDKGIAVQTVIDALVADATTDITSRITDMVNGVHPADTDDDAANSADATTSTTTG